MQGMKGLFRSTKAKDSIFISYRHKQPHAHIHLVKTTILAEVKGLSLFAAIGYMVREVFVLFLM